MMNMNNYIVRSYETYGPLLEGVINICIRLYDILSNVVVCCQLSPAGVYIFYLLYALIYLGVLSLFTS